MLPPAARLSHVFLWKSQLTCYCQKAVRLYSYYSSAIDRSPPSHAEGTSLAGIGCARSSICISASIYPSSLLLFCRAEWEVSGYNTADYISVSPQMAEFIFPQVYDKTGFQNVLLGSIF